MQSRAGKCLSMWLCHWAICSLLGVGRGVSDSGPLFNGEQKIFQEQLELVELG